MSLPLAFLREAERALAAGEAALAQAVHEKAGFLAYHSFESIGGAFCYSRGISYHPASHPEKVRRFVRACRQERFAYVVASLSTELVSLRNLLLYPQLSATGIIQLPERIITPAQVTRLIARVRALTRQVRRVI